MREARGETGPGLAGMRALALSPVWPEGRDIWLVRPMLAFRRTDLRVFLRARRIDWIDDPSNQDLNYERVRVRADLAGDPERWGHLQCGVEQAQTRRAEQDKRLAVWFSQHVSATDDGLICCDPGDLDTEDLAEALAHILMAAAGSDHRPPRAARLALARTILAGDWRAQTLGGAWIAPRQGRIHVARDPGEAAKQPPIPPDFTGVWDGRFLIDQTSSGQLAAVPAKEIASPLARDSLPQLKSPAQFAKCLIKSRLSVTKCLLEQDINKR